MNSIIQDKKVCFVCGKDYGLHNHHIYGGANRKVSEKYGLKVWLCPMHHNMSDAGVHFNKELDTKLKKIGQAVFETYYSRERFMKEIGRNYL